MPSSPSPGPSRTNTASTLSSPIHPQKSMSSIFISFPDEVECPTAIPGKRRAQARPSGSSELHLGMGRFALFDESVKPGPSPPCSPISSPTKRTFKVSAPDRNVQDRSQPRSPLTPSRAPRKAAKLLGAEGGYTTPLLRSSKKKEHFRPLPSQTLVEIEQFFGNVPRKQPKRAKSRQHQGDQTVEEQRTGEGRTVRHRGEDGTMWLDVEEEQEFAWLMSEMSAPMSTLPDRSGTDELLWEEGSDDEDSWGMESFTSVLTLPHSPLSGKGKGSIKLGAAPISLRAPRKRSDDSDSTVISSLRPKNRPPPLKLPFNKSATNSRLPQIAMGSPDRPKRNGSESEQPKTPFVRPRAVPPKPVAAIHLVSPVPKLQIFSMSEQDEDVSFFDPVTPIDPVSRSRPGRWLRKVAGGVRL